MTLPVQNSRVGTCPHGLPAGACPICSGMGGGGTRQIKQENTPKYEMSWSECYSIWQMMQAKQAREAAQKDSFLNQNIQNNSKQNLVTTFATNISNTFANMWKITQQPIQKIANTLNTKVFTPIRNFIQNIPQKMTTLFSNIKENLINISDKLAAIYGETKNFIEKKIADNLKNLPKKLFKLFGIFDADNEDEDEKRIEEEKRVLERNKIKETTNNLTNEKGMEYDEN